MLAALSRLEPLGTQHRCQEVNEQQHGHDQRSGEQDHGLSFHTRSQAKRNANIKTIDTNPRPNRAGNQTARFMVDLLVNHADVFGDIQRTRSDSPVGPVSTCHPAAHRRRAESGPTSFNQAASIQVQPITPRGLVAERAPLRDRGLTTELFLGDPVDYHLRGDQSIVRNTSVVLGPDHRVHEIDRRGHHTDRSQVEQGSSSLKSHGQRPPHTATRPKNWARASIPAAKVINVARGLPRQRAQRSSSVSENRSPRGAELAAERPFDHPECRFSASSVSARGRWKKAVNGRIV